MDSASDFGSGGWGFESPLGLYFWKLVSAIDYFFFVGNIDTETENSNKISDKKLQIKWEQNTKPKKGVMRESNSRPLAP